MGYATLAGLFGFSAGIWGEGVLGFSLEGFHGFRV